MRSFQSRRAKWRCSLYAALALLAAQPAAAANIKIERSSDGTPFIVLLGEIEPGDGDKFRRMSAPYSNAIVLLESEGGTLFDAIKIGSTIRDKEYATAVINGSSCNSSCALIWLAGSTRALSKSARIGFHAAYTLERGQSRESGVANAIIGRYLTLLNLPAKAVVFATMAPPSTLNWLTASNYARSGIDLKVISDIDFDEAQTSSGPETQIWKVVGNWKVAVDHTLNSDCFLIAAFNNNTTFRIGINSKDQFGYYLMMGNSNWKSLSAGQEYKLRMAFDFEDPWDVPTTVMDMKGLPVLIAVFTEKKFWTEFVAAEKLTVWRDRKMVTSLSMAGTGAAFSELIVCQRAYDAQKKSRDPFAK